MKFHSIEMVGDFILQKVDSLPVFSSPDKGRLLYNLNDNKFYYGSSIEWVELGLAGSISLGDITTDTPFLGAVIYDDGSLYYGNGTEWIELGLAGAISEGDIGTATPEVGAILYDDGSLYYGNGTEWIELFNAEDFVVESHDRSKHTDINQALLTSSNVVFNRVDVNGSFYDSSVRESVISSANPSGGKNGDVWYKY